ncbi:uncharacterized protein LOC111985928 [Quercus suber]|uniref:uncharacterized protein LOC111985928 n=1 Tax=Quercus suber TaxID=58331 RepID=UPI0032DEDA9F
MGLKVREYHSYFSIFTQKKSLLKIWCGLNGYTSNQMKNFHHFPMPMVNNLKIWNGYPYQNPNQNFPTPFYSATLQDSQLSSLKPHLSLSYKWARGSDLRVHFKGVWFAWRDRISLGFLVSDQLYVKQQQVVEVQAQAVSQLLLMTNHELGGTHFV